MSNTKRPGDPAESGRLLPPPDAAGDAVAADTGPSSGDTTAAKRRERIAPWIGRLRAMTSETLERMPLGFLALDHEHRVLYANPAALLAFGLTLDDVVGRRPWDLFPDFTETRFEAASRATTAGRMEAFEEHLAEPGRWIDLVIHRTLAGSVMFLRDVTERQEADARLRSTEELLRGSLEAMLDPLAIGTAVRDAAGRISGHRIDYYNKAARTWAGIGEEQVVGVLGSSVHPGLARLGLTEAISRVTETGEPLILTAFEYADVLVSGKAVRGVFDVQAVRLGDGVILTWRDVTEREAARHERDRLAAIVEQSPDGIVVIGHPDQRVVYANRAFTDAIGHAPAELLGQGALRFAEHVFDEATVARLRQVAEAGLPWLGEVEWRQADGTVSPVEIRVTPRPDGAGAPGDYVAVFRDVSELRRGEAERARLAAAVEQATDYIIVNDRDGRIQAVNPAFERLTGHEASAVLGRSMVGVLRSGIEAPSVYAEIDAAREVGDTWTGQLTVRRGDGGILDIDLSISPIHDSAGDLIGNIEIGRDRTHEREMEAEREREERVRAALAGSLAHVPADATLEQAAQSICDALTTLPFVDVARIAIFLGGDDVQVVAQSAPPGYPALAGSRLPPAWAAVVRERSAAGPWARYAESDPADGGARAAAVRSGLKAMACGPIVRGDHAVGALVLGTFDERFARLVVEEMPGVVSFGATSSALLGERMDARRREHELRASLEAVLAGRAFRPVFQPIVDLGSRVVVGYEALTRFESGQRADLSFADAWSVGLGPELELATLDAAVAVGTELPAGRWLDLNVSPRLLADPGRLAGVLRAADRPVVLEVTEHDVIEDYGAIREAVRALGREVRVAVDDAGAGVANFGHIIDLRPDFVKLDVTLVRRVNANMGRQAMVVGLRHFSRSTGCRLVAEGIETEAEARTLDELGVEFGQGYLFGRPEPAGAWAGPGSAAPERS